MANWLCTFNCFPCYLSDSFNPQKNIYTTLEITENASYMPDIVESLKDIVQMRSEQGKTDQLRHHGESLKSKPAEANATKFKVKCSGKGSRWEVDIHLSNSEQFRTGTHNVTQNTDFYFAFTVGCRTLCENVCVCYWLELGASHWHPQSCSRKAVPPVIGFVTTDMDRALQHSATMLPPSLVLYWS